VCLHFVRLAEETQNKGGPMATVRKPAPGKLPKNTPISNLGFTPDQLQKLTPAARSLTKGDLIALQKWAISGGKGSAPEHLTIQDLNSLQKATGNPATFIAKAMKRWGNDGVSCCCCTPCCSCTAAAEIAPVRNL